jgi:predicted phosphoribosyltransferase
VVTAAVLAQELGAELDVVLVRKLRSPWQPELALGAIAEDGSVFLDPRQETDSDEIRDYLATEIRKRMRELEERRALFRAVRPSAKLTGRSVILADDGIATGSTVMAALHVLRAQKPKELIVATPIIAAERVAEIESECDELVAESVSDDFYAIGQFYQDFSTVEDEEAVRLLREAQEN